MYPLLLSIGPLQIYSISVTLVLAWLVFSFALWRHLRSCGIDEEKIFDLTFWSTLVSAVLSRLVYVALNWEIFSESWLMILTIWVEPGFSLYGAFVGALGTFIVLSKVKKIRLGYILDALSFAFPLSLCLALIGVLLDGSVPGSSSTIPWAIRYIGEVGLRHPVQIYELLSLFVIIWFISYLQKRSIKEKWPYGVVGVWFLLLYSASMFLLEFFKDTHVYWISLRANQWILLAIFAESMGAFYVRCGGREWVRPKINTIQKKFTNLVGGIYAKFSKRSA